MNAVWSRSALPASDAVRPAHSAIRSCCLPGLRRSAGCWLDAEVPHQRPAWIHPAVILAATAAPVLKRRMSSSATTTSPLTPRWHRLVTFRVTSLYRSSLSATVKLSQSTSRLLKMVLPNLSTSTTRSPTTTTGSSSRSTVPVDHRLKALNERPDEVTSPSPQARPDSLPLSKPTAPHSYPQHALFPASSTVGSETLANLSRGTKTSLKTPEGLEQPR